MPTETPGAFGIDHLTKLVVELGKDMGAVLRHQNSLLQHLHRIENLENKLMSQLEEMDTKLENIANQETVLGQSIQQVVDFLKANVPPSPDLTAQLAKLDTIAQTLVDTNASTLANLPPTPAPAPAARRK